MGQAFNQDSIYFRVAPWPALLTWVSLLATVLLCAVSYAAWLAIPPHEAVHVVGTIVASLPPMIIPIALLFVVRGYEFDDTELRIERLFWHTVISLDGISQVSSDPSLLKGSLRIFGNGGLFSFTGYYRNKRIGNYRAFITDWKHSVVLMLPGGVIAVSPENPAQFIAELQKNFAALQVATHQMDHVR